MHIPLHHTERPVPRPPCANLLRFDSWCFAALALCAYVRGHVSACLPAWSLYAFHTKRTFSFVNAGALPMRSYKKRPRTAAAESPAPVSKRRKKRPSSAPPVSLPDPPALDSPEPALGTPHLLAQQAKTSARPHAAIIKRPAPHPLVNPLDLYLASSTPTKAFIARALRLLDRTSVPHVFLHGLGKQVCTIPPPPLCGSTALSKHRDLV